MATQGQGLVDIYHNIYQEQMFSIQLLDLLLKIRAVLADQILYIHYTLMMDPPQYLKRSINGIN